MGGWGSNRWGTYRRKTRVEDSLALESAAFCENRPSATLDINWGKDDKIKVKRTEKGLFITYEASKIGEIVNEALNLSFNTKSNRWYWIAQIVNGT